MSSATFQRRQLLAAATGLPDQFQISLTWQEASEAFSYQTSTFLIPVTP